MYNLAKCPCLTFLQIMGIFFQSSFAQLANTNPPEVTIIQGKLQGAIFTTNQKRNISGFLGIPYGQPPIGNLRFANPVAAEGWNGTRNATVDSNVCPQLSGNVVMGEEDCLYLNVYTPQLPEGTNTSLLPVMVYIHGGGFLMGSAQSDLNNPGYLLDEDLVLVVPNYRLGPLGFMSTGDEIASGNWGLKDQVLALNWVQGNIRYFGGNPDQVTLFGVSAGSVSVHILTLSDLTIGLFHKCIMQSGSAIAPWAYQPRATYAKLAFQLGEYVGCSNDTSDSLIDCLRKIDFSEIIATRSQFFVWESHPVVLWTSTDEPDIEGAILTDSPTDLFANGRVRDLPYIFGIVRDEGAFYAVEFHKDEEMFDHVLKNLDSLLPVLFCWTHESELTQAAWVKAIKSYYFHDDLTANRSLLLSNYTLLISDVMFFHPTHNALRRTFAVAENPQYFYTFNYRGTYSKTYYYGDYTTDYGVVHGDDVLYLFPPEPNFPNLNASVSETDYKIVDTMVHLWTSFATNGTPTSLTLNGVTTWKPYSTEDNYLRIGNGSDVALEVQYSFFKERMQFWDDLLATTATAAAINFYSNPFLILLIVSFKFVS